MKYDFRTGKQCFLNIPQKKKREKKPENVFSQDILTHTPSSVQHVKIVPSF